MKFVVTPVPDESIWRRHAESIRGKNHLCISPISCLISVKVSETLYQKPYFQSCDWNTAMSVANNLEIGLFEGLPVPY